VIRWFPGCIPYREMRALPHVERVNDEIRALGSDIDARAVAVRSAALSATNPSCTINDIAFRGDPQTP
jgi:hypothetical protein